MKSECDGKPGPGETSGWEDIIRTLLPQPGVDQAEYMQLDQIIAVLNKLGSEPPDTHLVRLPGGESIAIARASIGAEPGYIQIEDREGSLFVCKPRSMVCFRVSKALDMSYLDLELNGLTPLDDTNVRTDRKEDLYGPVRAADGTARKDDFTRLLSGRLLIGCKNGCPRYFEGKVDDVPRKGLRRFVEMEANRRIRSL
jgi:hypothetical protein